MRVARLALRCLFGGDGLRSVVRRFRYVPLATWVRHPAKALLFLAVRPYTMLSYARLSCLYGLARGLDLAKIPGAIVECGTWRGGSAAVLAKASGCCIHIFDSFQGCPAPSELDVNCQGRKGEAGEARASTRDVRGLFDALGLHATIWPGWFRDTLPRAQTKAEVGPIALLHLDCDWYGSVKVCMEHLWPLVVPGGYVVLDDAGHWPNTLRAVQDVAGPIELTWTDQTGAWWRKG